MVLIEFVGRDTHLDAIAPLPVYESNVAAHPIHSVTALTVRGDGTLIIIINAEIDPLKPQLAELMMQ